MCTMNPAWVAYEQTGGGNRQGGPFTVTATQNGSTSLGMAMTVVVVTGQSASQPGAVIGATNITPSDSITPSGSGSWVYGSVLTLAGTPTAVAGTTIEQSTAGGGLQYISVRTTGTMTSGTPVTVGVTSTANGISIALCEILATGTLAEDASSPAPVPYASSLSATTATFTPPVGSLLVAMVQSNGGGGATTMALTDTSGLGLTWVEQEKQDTAGDGYAGVWTSLVT